MTEVATLAQLVEHRIRNARVASSSLVSGSNDIIFYRGVAQLASVPRSGRGGRRFESSYPDFFLFRVILIYEQ